MEELKDRVLSLHHEKKWKDILELSDNCDINQEKKLLWVWPSLKNLKFIRDTTLKFRLKEIVSIGCGCGLLEWILQESMNDSECGILSTVHKISVIGYEINKEWWDSKYSNPQFIPLKYPVFPLEKNGLNEDAALLFCYFNDGQAFIDYINAYKGFLVFIIGPGEGRYTHTNPEPFKPNFGTSRWKLMDYQEVKDTKDYIAVYVRDLSASG